MFYTSIAASREIHLAIKLFCWGHESLRCELLYWVEHLSFFYKWIIYNLRHSVCVHRILKQIKWVQEPMTDWATEEDNMHSL